MAVDALHCNSIPSPPPWVSDSVDRLSETPHASTGKAGGPGCLAAFTGHIQPVTGFALHQGDAISFAGPHLGVLSLHGPPYSETVVPTRLSNLRGGKDLAPIVGLSILPHSRLLVAGTEDGVIKICH